MAFTPELPNDPELQQSQFVPALPADPDFQAPTVTPQVTQPTGNTAVNIGAHVLGDLGTIGGDILNVPHHIYSGIPAYNPGYDYYKPLGVQPNLADKVGVNVAEYAPYATGAGAAVDALGIGGKILPTIAQNELGNVAFGATQNDDNASGAIKGAATGGLASVLGIGGSAIGKAGANLYAKTAIPGLIQKGTDALKTTLGNANDYAAKFLQRFQGADMANEANWKMANANADNLDSQMSAKNTPFNAQPVTDYISGFLDKVKGMTPMQARPYQNAVDFAQNEASQILPQNFSDLVAGRQIANDTLSDFLKKRNLDQADNQTQEFVKGWKDSLVNDVPEANKSAVNADDFNNFKDSWENANQSHQYLQQFKNTTNTAGAQTPSNVLATARNAQSPEGGILSQFMPATTQTGTNEIENLGNLYGDQGEANNALLSYKLRQATDAEKSPNQAMNIYRGFSPEQRQALYQNNPSQPYFSTANRGVEQYGMPKTAPQGFLPKLGYHALAASPAGLLGFGGGLAMGMPWEHALMLGAGTAFGGKLGAKGIQKMATPNSVNAAMNYAQAPIQTGLLSRYVIPAMTAPGGQ